MEFDSPSIHLALRTEPNIRCVVCGSTMEVPLTNARIILRLKNVEFDSHLAHSEELQSSEIRSLTLKSSANGILLCSSHKRRIGCMLRQHPFSLRQPSSALPKGGV